MKQIVINHAPHSGGVKPLATSLLLVGACTFVSAAVYLQQLTAASASIKAQIEAKAAPNISNKKPVQNTASELEMNAAVNEILLPWPALFNALEQANQDDIKLLRIEPKVQGRSLRIIAMTFRTENMMAYIKRLSAQNMLKQVSLLSTEPVEVAGQMAMQFELRMDW